MTIKLYTIGFTKKRAETFFNLLIENKVKTLVDIRINRNSQLSGFAKSRDLPYFLKQLAGIKYCVKTEFAPTRELLTSYREKLIGWEKYEKLYIGLLDRQRIAGLIYLKAYDCACFLCSEHLPDKCHRRLLVEYLKEKLPEKDIEIVHL